MLQLLLKTWKSSFSAGPYKPLGGTVQMLLLLTPKQAILEWDIQTGTNKLFIPAKTLILQNTQYRLG